VRATATSFPLSKQTGGGDTAPTFSGLRVCLQLTWEVGLPPLLWSFPPTALLQAFPLLIAGYVLLLLPAGMFVYSSGGMWVFPPLLWSFPPSATLTSFPTPGCWACAPLPPEPLRPGPACLFTVLGKIPLPPLSAQCAPPSLQGVFIVLIANKQ
jgi:hypothetical protein